MNQFITGSIITEQNIKGYYNMYIFLECKKIKHTGLLPAFLGCGMLAGAVPIVNMAVRSKLYLSSQGSPVQILLQANWQLMAMLNILAVIAGTCMFYQIEHSERALLKMRSLPVSESTVFFGKAVLAILLSAVMLAIEAGAAAFCVYYWFETGNVFLSELCQSFGYAFLLMLPCTVLSLLISEACTNMWISLGIGIVCMFTATMLPADSFFPSLFPYAVPFQIFTDTEAARIMHYIYAAAAELVILCLAELLFIKIRRQSS